MSEHTPTPWAAMGDRGDIKSVCKGFPERIVAKVSGQPTLEERAANAALIVRSVNAHAKLVAALEATLCELTACANQLAARGLPGRAGDSVSRAQALARAALASLKESA